MKTCPNCNTTLQENDRFYPACCIAVATEPQPTQQQTAGRQAAPQQPPVAPMQNQAPNYTVPPVQPPFVQPPYSAAPQRKMSGGMLAWSIINIVLGVLFGLPTLVLGIVATVKTAQAAKAFTDYEEQAMLKTAKTLNLTGTIIAGVILILLVAIGVILGSAFGELISEAINNGVYY